MTTYGHIEFNDEISAFVEDVNKTNVQLHPEVRQGVLVGWDVSTEEVTRIYLNLTDPRKAVDRFGAETGASLTCDNAETEHPGKECAHPIYADSFYVENNRDLDELYASVVPS